MISVLRLPDYPIYIGDCIHQINDTITSLKPSRVILLADHPSEQYCLPLLQKESVRIDATIIIATGEKHKSLATCEKIWQRMFDLKTDRKSLLINLGGGVIGDMGGFCASTYMRGIPFIQVPTTLLSQVDASIGGKLGIDFYGLKNSIGLFRDPVAVFADPVFLQTLPQKELRSGFAEVIKHGLIKDRRLWKTIISAAGWSHQNWEDVVNRSLQVKQKVVEKDPYETGVRKILNFGHTIGHAVESVMIEIDHPVLHGDAVAAGMIAEAFLSHAHGNLPVDELETISNYLIGVYGQLPLAEIGFNQLMNKMIHDKKNQGASINFTYLDRIGKSSINHTASPVEIRESLDYYASL